ncbi:FtsX-like permease family protein [bacterium]|nr:FtsX-like permease family protein [bacterium]
MRPLSRLLFRGWLGRSGRTILAMAGVAIGVAVLLAVRLANYSAIEAFTRSLELIAGRADLEVVAPANGLIPIDIYPKLSRLKSVESAAPIYSLRGRVGENERSVQLMGVDMARDSQLRPWYRAELSEDRSNLELFTNPGAVLITPKLAEELSLSPGDRFPFSHSGKTDTLELIGFLEGEEVAKARSAEFLVIDLPRAWQMDGGLKGLQRIDVILKNGIDPKTAQTALQTFLPEGTEVKLAGYRRPQAEKMLSAFKLNLTALAFVALLVSGFLVYQTVTASALERRTQAGILRSIGAGRGFIIRLFLVEGAALGVVGSLLGVPLGILMASLAGDAVSQTVSSLYLLENTDGYHLSPIIVAGSILLGIIVSILAVTPVAIETSRTPPRENWSRQTLEDKLNPIRLFIVGVGVAILGSWFAIKPIPQFPVIGGYFAAACWVFAMALMTPTLLGWFYKLIIFILKMKAGAYLRLVMGVLVRSRHRVTPAVAALATAVAMWLSVDMMVRSFRGTVDAWVGSTITADLIVTGSGSLAMGKAELMPGSTFETLQNVEAFSDVDCFRSVQLTVNDEQVLLAMVHFPSLAKQQRLTFLETPVDQDPYEAVLNGSRGCFITEPMAFHQKLKTGDTLTVPTPSGDQRLPIFGVYQDYASDKGLVLVDREWFVEKWRDDRVASIAVYLPEDVDNRLGREFIEQNLPEELKAEIFSNAQLRSAVLDVFDNTFAITYALEAVAILVALMAVGGGMAALVTERTRELAILRAMGASHGQTIARVLAESGLLGIVAWILGSVLGTILSLILIHVVNKYSFGWSLVLQIQWSQIILAGVLLVGAALLAGVIPALRAARIPIATSVRFE